jgi:DNA-binding MurR/RpiR family transcriptional regulator
LSVRGGILQPALIDGRNMERTGADDLTLAVSSKYDELTAGQKRVIDRLLSDVRYGAVASAARVARDAAVSEATVTRAAQALGYLGFPALQAKLRERLIRPVSDRIAESTNKLGESPETVALNVIREDAEDVRQTAEYLTPESIRAAVDALAAARRVYVFAARGSFGLATMFSVGVRLLVPDSLLLSQTAGDLPDQLVGITSKDALVAFSFRRLDVVTVRVLEVAKKASATTIAITDVGNNQASRLADIALNVQLNRLRLQPSFAPGASVVNGLLTALAVTLGSKTGDRLRKAEALWREFDTHVWEDDDGQRSARTSAAGQGSSGTRRRSGPSAP